MALAFKIFLSVLVFWGFCVLEWDAQAFGGTEKQIRSIKALKANKMDEYLHYPERP